MKVLHVHSGNMWGGVETVLHTLWRNRHVTPDVKWNFALCFRGKFSDDLSNDGAPVEYLAPARVRRPDLLFKARQRLRALLSRDRFDVAIVHSSWSRALFGGVVNAAGIPLVHWVHDALTGRHWLDRLAFLNGTSLILCNSNFVRSLVIQHHPHARIEVLYYPLLSRADRPVTSNRMTTRAMFATSETSTVIVQASRFQPWKGHEHHLRALALTPVEMVSWFLGAAQGPTERRYVAQLRKLASELGVSDRVRWVGHRADVMKLLPSADILCQPNLGPEPFGISFVEAMAAGLPVVTSAMGGALEVVDESSGILVPPGDTAALANALNALAHSASLRRQLGSGGLSRSYRLCSVEEQMPALETSLKAVL